MALNEFERHPIAGIGSRGWAASYLAQGRSLERPARAHSVEMDALSETGIVGFLLLIAGGLAALVAAGRRAVASMPAASLLAAGGYFAVHTGGDWVWSIPAAALPAFLMLGIAAAPDRGTRLPARVALPAGVLAGLAALMAFAPPWLSSRLTDRAYKAPSAAAAAEDLRWARRLDPLAVDPLLAAAALATPPANISPLIKAVGKQPRDVEVHYLLGLAYLDLGRTALARRELRLALALSPRDDAVRNALRRAGENP